MTIIIENEVILTPIPAFPNYRCDTINGRVWSEKREDWLVSNPNENGYCYVDLRNDDKDQSKSYPLHRVVMASYYGDSDILFKFKETKIEVDHIEENLKHVNGIHNLD